MFIRRGFVDRSASRALTEASDKADQERRSLTGLFPQRGPELITAQLTSYDSATGFYTWIPRMNAGDGTRFDDTSSYAGGDHNQNPAVVLNGGTIDVSSPVDVHLRFLGVSATLGRIMEVVGFAGGTGVVGGFTETVVSIAAGTAKTSVGTVTLAATGDHLITGKAGLLWSVGGMAADTMHSAHVRPRLNGATGASTPNFLSAQLLISDTATQYLDLSLSVLIAGPGTVDFEITNGAASPLLDCFLEFVIWRM